jgi:hypothetical protein
MFLEPEKMMETASATSFPYSEITQRPITTRRVKGLVSTRIRSGLDASSAGPCRAGE